MGRMAAKKSLKMDEFHASMNGIWSSCISESTLDEAPMVYKNKDEVVELIKPTVTVLFSLKPVYNFKAVE